MKDASHPFKWLQHVIHGRMNVVDKTTNSFSTPYFKIYNLATKTVKRFENLHGNTFPHILQDLTDRTDLIVANSSLKIYMFDEQSAVTNGL